MTNQAKVTDISPNMGCDPEFFFRRDGQVIGAEKLLPQKGLIAGTGSKFVIDGIQAELNPAPNYCRANLANEIRACFTKLHDEILKHGKNISVDFGRTIEISKENLDELTEQSKKFGCAPSLSIYKHKSGLKIDEINAEEYRTRAAGGHIHIGKNGVTEGLIRALTTDHAKTVAMLDLICGNTSVLVDRDPGNVERRKVYGRAGEFRLPPHGLEYRTLSNYWLTSYPLMSFAFGLARLSVQLIADKNHEMFYNEFMSKVKARKVHVAINRNDFDLAMENFQAIEKLLLEVLPPYTGGRYPFDKGNIKAFHHFVSTVESKGLTYWFNQDPMTHWLHLQEAHRGGFYDFLNNEVFNDMKKVEKEKQLQVA